MPLTVLAIEKLKPGPSRREVPDGLVTGLYLVMQPTGARSWAVRYRAGGQPRKHTLGTYPAIDLKNARELAQRALVEVAKGEDPAAAKHAAKATAKVPADREFVDKVVESFIERYAKANTRESSWRETQRILKREVVSNWQGKRLAEIGRADVHELLDGIRDRGKPIMANRTLAALRKMFGWAVERGLIVTTPCEKIKAPSAERSRDRVLSDPELKQVWGACDTLGWPFGPLVKLLILTGQRREEVAQIRWSELNLPEMLWTLPRERAKNDRLHTVPLSNEAVSILKDLPRTGDLVFSTNGQTPVSGFSKAKARIDRMISAPRMSECDQAFKELMPPWVLHDLRRTAATGMARLGITLPVIERVLNHISGSFSGIVGVYQRHGFADEKREALQRWGEFVTKLTSHSLAR